MMVETLGVEREILDVSALALADRFSSFSLSMDDMKSDVSNFERRVQRVDMQWSRHLATGDDRSALIHGLGMSKSQELDDRVDKLRREAARLAANRRKKDQ